MDCSSSAYRVCSNVDLLTKILAGLPLSSLRRCKSVCKRWLSLITDLYFNSLRNRNPNAHHPCGLFLQLQRPSSVFPDYLPLKTSSPSIITTTSFPFYPSSTHIVLLQSCNGVLLCYDPPDKVYVFNPTINRCKLLPLPPIRKPYSIHGYLMALAFDPKVSIHYKVVYPSIRPGGEVHVDIYSSETGNWKACTQIGLEIPPFVKFDWRVVYWNGAVHWLFGKHLFHLSLLLLDDNNNNNNILQVDDDACLSGIAAYGARDRLFVSRFDSLLLVKMLDEHLQMNVYEMKDKSSGWSIKYHVNLKSVGNFLGPYFNVVAIVLEEDSFLVLEEGLSMLIQYNISSNTFHQICDFTQTPLLRAQYGFFLFTPSLVGV